mgnify:CR=1 FL=1
MISFAWPWLFTLLPLPILIYLLPTKRNTASAALKMPMLLPGISEQGLEKDINKIHPLLIIVIWILLVCAITRPQWLGEAINVPTESREMMIAVDLSGSITGYCAVVFWLWSLVGFI